ncbi:hypothetical protein ACRS42_21460 [Bacillus thuringiensis]|uniref:beta barrel domain-containing protein n=1 Tax=Bacillus thuringiensis TaxID=1428 RepID=UPI003EE08202
MNKIEEGQEVFVSSQNVWIGSEEPGLSKYIVVTANKSSFYAIPESFPGYKPIRFSQKTLSHNTRWGFRYQAYRSAKEYWDIIERGKEKVQLRKELEDTIEKMSLVELRRLKEVLFLTK